MKRDPRRGGDLSLWDGQIEQGVVQCKSEAKWNLESEKQRERERERELRISCAQGRPNFRLEKKRLDPKYTRWALVRALRVIPVREKEKR